MGIHIYIFQYFTRDLSNYETVYSPLLLIRIINNRYKFINVCQNMNFNGNDNIE